MTRQYVELQTEHQDEGTANIPNTPMQHGYKTQHSTVTALHTLNNTVAKGFNQMAPPARTITVALDMSKAFDTINIHTLIRMLLQTNIPGTIIKFIANYIKGRKAYTTTTAAVEEFQNLFCSHHLFPLINKPTRETKPSKTIIDNIYCNIPHVLDISNTGIIRTYISDHHAIFCLFNETKLQDYKQNSTMKRSFCEKNIAQFSHNLKKMRLGILFMKRVHRWHSRGSKASLICSLTNAFKKRLFKMTYQNRYPWMTNEMRTRITRKNKLGYKVFLNPENINLKNEYKLKRNRLISDLRNMEINYSSNELEINKFDI